MSDGITDGYRDEQRTRMFRQFLMKVGDRIKHPEQVSVASVVRSAQRVDDIHGGYWSKETDLTVGTKGFLEKLQNKDPQAWGRFLYDLSQHLDTIQLYHEMQEISPWPGKKVKYLDFIHWNDNQFEGMIKQAMHRAGNATEYRGNPNGWFEYVVFYTDGDSLDEIAKTAVCMRIVRGGWTTDKSVPFIPPTSHRLDYLEDRMKMFKR